MDLLRETNMKVQKRFEIWIVILVAVVLFSPSLVHHVTGGPGATLQGTMSLQRTVDTPSPGPFGSVSLVQSANGKQTFNVDVKQLEGQSFGIYFATNNTFDTNAVFFLGSLDLKTNGHWAIQYSAVGSAPPQLTTRIPGVTDLMDMAGLFIFVSNPSGSTNFSGCVTNITGCTTNIVGGVTNFDNCVTNIDSCVTNPVVNGVLVAEVPPLLANASAFNFKGKAILGLPIAPPSPNAKGFITTKFNAKTGTSLLDIRATGLNGGQVYTVYFSTTPGGLTFTNLSITLNQVGNSFSFHRDTRLGETLPLLASTVTNLSGINIEIRDAFDDLHLGGTIP